MTLTQKILGVASLGFAFVSASFAQQSTSNSASLLGVQYVEVGFGYLDINNSATDAFALGADVNVPLTANLDLNVGYGYGWAENNGSLYANSVSADLVAYLTEGALRPFVTGGLGYVWESNSLGGDEYATWDVGVGAEYSFNDTTSVAALVSYDDDFESGDNHSISGTVQANHWFTSTLAGTIGVSWLEYGDIGYAVSAIFKF